MLTVRNIANTQVVITFCEIIEATLLSQIPHLVNMLKNVDDTPPFRS